MSIRFPNLDINLGHIAKSLNFFGYEITVYGMLMAAGMLLGLLVVLTQARRQNQNTNLYLGVVILSILGGVIGARAYYVAFSWELFQNQDLNVFFDLRSGGLAIYGGIFGGMLVAFVFCCIRRVSFGRIADIACTGLLAGQSISIWGNFFNRASFGKYTDSLLAMQLPLNAVSSGEVTKTIREQIVNVNGTDYIQVHPLFFYESIWCLLLLVFLLIYNRRKSFQGELFLRYPACPSFFPEGAQPGKSSPYPSEDRRAWWLFPGRREARPPRPGPAFLCGRFFSVLKYRGAYPPHHGR